MERITKKEKQAIISSLIISFGTWLLVSPIYAYISETWSKGVSMILGVGVIIFGLWRFRIN